MGRYDYSDSEKETLRVLKMQQEETQSLSDATKQDSSELADLHRRAEALLRKKGISPNSVQASTKFDNSLKISRDNIPTWDDLAKKTYESINYDVELEDLLSKDEFQFCIDEVQRINDEFSQKTGLYNKKDISFLMVATALQTARWLIIQKLLGDLGQSIDDSTRLNHNDKTIKEQINKSNSKFQDTFEGHGHEPSKKYKSWEQIIFSSAPFDTTVGSPNFGENLGGAYHRYRTLGHDPILGWIFGTANFITDTCTLSNYNSYRISRKGTPHFSEITNLPVIFSEVFDSTKEDWLRLPAGLFAEFVHLRSDAFTKLGLPVPILETFSESLAGDLYKSQYDSLCLLKDLKIVGNQAAWSILINMIIGLLHGFMFDESRDHSKKLYEVRTRKILCISNSLASAGNIAYSIISEDWKKLDVGGIMVSLYRLFTDVRFITKVKSEFIKCEMDKVLERELINLDSNFVD